MITNLQMTVVLQTVTIAWKSVGGGGGQQGKRL